MSLEPPLTRVRNADEPLPANRAPSKAALALKRKQRRLIWSAAGVVALLAGGWFVYSYIAGAPQRARSQFDIGMHAMNPGKYPDAIAAFNRAIDIWPKFAEAYLNRGIAEHNLSDRQSAAADFDTASDLDPSLTRAFDERGRLYLETGDIRRAIDEFTKSIRLQATTDGYYARGLAYEKVGEHRKAVSDFDEAIAEMRDAPYAYRARAFSKEALGDSEGARIDRETALRIEAHP